MGRGDILPDELFAQFQDSEDFRVEEGLGLIGFCPKDWSLRGIDMLPTDRAKVYGLDPERLYASYFAGDEETLGSSWYVLCIAGVFSAICAFDC